MSIYYRCGVDLISSKVFPAHVLECDHCRGNYEKDITVGYFNCFRCKNGFIINPLLDNKETLGIYFQCQYNQRFVEIENFDSHCKNCYLCFRTVEESLGGGYLIFCQGCKIPTYTEELKYYTCLGLCRENEIVYVPLSKMEKHLKKCSSCQHNNLNLGGYVKCEHSAFYVTGTLLVKDDDLVVIPSTDCTHY
jgi:hypothetical protein